MLNFFILSSLGKKLSRFVGFRGKASKVYPARSSKIYAITKAYARKISSNKSPLNVCLTKRFKRTDMKRRKLHFLFLRLNHSC